MKTGFCELVGYNPRDHYFKKAKKENFAARSIYKLEEIDQRYRVIKRGGIVLDLGCSPGSWSQYASQKVGETGRVLGVDLQPVTVSLPNAVFIQADLYDLNLEETFQQHGFTPPFDAVISDMAPKTTGIKFTDQTRSTQLCELAIATADRFLKKGGHFVCKFFHSGDFGLMKKELNRRYKRVEVVKPDATREISKEIFFVGLEKL